MDKPSEMDGRTHLKIAHFIRILPNYLRTEIADKALYLTDFGPKFCGFWGNVPKLQDLRAKSERLVNGPKQQLYGWYD